jgi:hypothetical protein
MITGAPRRVQAGDFLITDCPRDTVGECGWTMVRQEKRFWERTIRKITSLQNGLGTCEGYGGRTDARESGSMALLKGALLVSISSFSHIVSDRSLRDTKP